MTTDISRLVPLTTLPPGGNLLIAKTSQSDPTRRDFALLVPAAVGGPGGAGSAPGGTAGQLQWNHGGVLDGVTLSGDATLDPASGIVTLAGKGSANGPVIADSANKVPLGQLPLLTRTTPGAVPPPGSGSAITKFLCEDLSWRIPPGSTGVADIPTTTIDGSIIPATSGQPYQMLATDFRVLCASSAPAFLILPVSPVLGVEYVVFSPLTGAATNITSVSAPAASTVQGTTLFQQMIDGEAVSYMALSQHVWRLV